MKSIVLLLCLVPLIAARGIEQERLTLDRDAEIVPDRNIEAVDVPAAGDNDQPTGSEGEEGRQFSLFPRVRIFRMPPMFQSPGLFPDFFSPPSRRPSIFSPSFGGVDFDRRVDVKTGPTSDVEEATKDAETVVPDSGDRRPVHRRPVFTSLSDVFSDFNRRMQAFEDEISGLFRTLVRAPPAEEREPVPAAPADSDASSSTGSDVDRVPAEDDEEDQHPFFGFDVFRPFRPVFGGSGGLFPGFRNPAEFPNDYKNSTSKTEVINGTRVMINETVHKGGDENSSHFVHFKVIHMLPEDGEKQAEDAAQPEDSENKPASTDAAEAPEITKVADETEEKAQQHGVDSGLVSGGDESKRDEAKAVEGVNPEDFGYQVGDNEIDKTDTVVVNLPAAADAKLPTGADSA
jgi:hypothetical protein